MSVITQGFRVGRPYYKRGTVQTDFSESDAKSKLVITFTFLLTLLHWGEVVFDEFPFNGRTRKNPPECFLFISARYGRSSHWEEILPKRPAGASLKQYNLWNRNRHFYLIHFQLWQRRAKFHSVTWARLTVQTFPTCARARFHSVSRTFGSI